MIPMQKPMPLHVASVWLIAVLIAALPVTTFAQAAVSPAAIVAGQLGTPGRTILSVSDFTVQTDPDLLLGAPGQYIARARFVDTAGVQGDVEVFANARDARTHLGALAGAVTAGQEVDVTEGLVLVRLYNLLGDSQAYQAALAAAVTPP
jgi:hypothetical protein